MIITHTDLLDKLRDFASPKAKITRLLESEELIQLRRGLYLDSKHEGYSLFEIANTLYGPSYVSFESALSFYGFIPEKVQIVMSASFKKNKTKTYATKIANFHYYHVPDLVFPWGVDKVTEGDHSFLIAIPEKALLDTLYRISKYDNDLEELLYSDLRLDKKLLKTLDLEIIKQIAPDYTRNICQDFARWLEKEALG
ncbi:hypothetical protein JEZ13_09450 [bacterium]|nr:hypothetical protein [bacterium]